MPNLSDKSAEQAASRPGAGGFSSTNATGTGLGVHRPLSRRAGVSSLSFPLQSWSLGSSCQ